MTASSRSAARMPTPAAVAPSRTPSPQPAPARVGANDRLTATLALALIVHGIVILGVGFTADAPAPIVPTLDVILTRTHSLEPPRQADFLAPSNQQGGGDHERAQRPREEQIADVPKPTPGVAAQPLQAQAPTAQPESAERVITSAGGVDPVPAAEATPAADAMPLPTGPVPTQQSMEMARLAAEIERRSALYAKRPTRKFVSASTREYEYATYLHSWVARVERVGNINYPDEARRRRLGGLVMMQVSIRRDGTVADIEITQPSAYPLLDAAAVRIVRLAEPFPPLPVTSENVDILVITRTWRFLPGGAVRDER